MSASREAGAVVIVGAGIAGLTLARELALRSGAVTVVERDRILPQRGGQGATSASVGILTAPRAGRSPLRRLQARAHGIYPEFVRRVVDESGMDVGYRVSGALLVQRGPLRERTRTRLEALHREGGVDCRWIRRLELERLLPGVSPSFSEALYLPEEGAVDPSRLRIALAASCRNLGVEIVEGCGEARLRLGSLSRLELPSGDRVVVHRCVLAAGAWSAGVPEPAEAVAALPLRPIRGQVVEVRLPGACRKHIRFRPGGAERDYHLVPPFAPEHGNGPPRREGDDRVWIGSTVEDAGFECATTEAGREDLLAAAADLLPVASSVEVLGHWAGLRPQALRRGGPLLGKLPGREDVWVHCGHYRSGILLAPLTGRLLAARMLGDEETVRREGFDLSIFHALRVDR